MPTALREPQGPCSSGNRSLRFKKSVPEVLEGSISSNCCRSASCRVAGVPGPPARLRPEAFGPHRMTTAFREPQGPCSSGNRSLRFKKSVPEVLEGSISSNCCRSASCRVAGVPGPPARLSPERSRHEAGLRPYAGTHSAKTRVRAFASSRTPLNAAPSDYRNSPAPGPSLFRRQCCQRLRAGTAQQRHASGTTAHRTSPSGSWPCHR